MIGYLEWDSLIPVLEDRVSGTTKPPFKEVNESPKGGKRKGNPFEVEEVSCAWFWSSPRVTDGSTK